MGADLITVGFTVEHELASKTSSEILRTFAATVQANINKIDSSGYMDEMSAEDNDAAINHLIDGFEAIKSYAFPYNSWDVPGTGYSFIVAGGETWGDPPFEDYDAVNCFLEAINIIPAMGEATGVLGSGILASYYSS